MEKIEDSELIDMLNQFSPFLVSSEKKKQDLTITDEDMTNLKMFLTWCKSNLGEDCNVKFIERFSIEYRKNLYDVFIKYYCNHSIITDELVYCWKQLIKSIILENKKYIQYHQDITIFQEYCSENKFILSVKKGMFICHIDTLESSNIDNDDYVPYTLKETFCYVKNGDISYYVS